MNKRNSELSTFLENLTNDPVGCLTDVLKLFNPFGETNVTSDMETTETVNITVNKEMSDEEYKQYLEDVVSAYTVSASVGNPDKFTLKFECKDRNILTYEWDNENKKFNLCGEECIQRKEVSEIDNRDPYVENDKKEETKDLVPVDSKPSGVDFSVKEAPASLSQALRRQVNEMNDMGCFDDYSVFDVEEAMERMLELTDNYEYEPVFDNANEIKSIKVDIEYLCDDFDADCDDAEFVLNEENDKIHTFVNRCIKELGFSNVHVEETENEDGDKVIDFIFEF